MAGDALISVVIAWADDRAIAEDYLPRLHATCQRDFRQFEILLIDNDSRDGTGPWLLQQLKQLPFLRYVRLTRNHSWDVAVSAGLDLCTGDYAVLIDPYLDEPASLAALVEASSRDEAIVTVRRDPGAVHGSGYALTSKFFYSLLRWTGIENIPPHVISTRVYPRQALVAMSKVRLRNRKLKFVDALIGLPQREVSAPPSPLAGRRPASSMLTAIRQGIDTVVVHSAAPLRMAAGLGLFAALGSTAFIVYVIAVALFKKNNPEGWLTLAMILAIMFTLLFTILAVLSEYIARILDEVQDRPLYFIAFERDSAVSNNQHPPVLNVV